MTPSGHNTLLILLFSGTLIIAAVAPCSGLAVVDVDGKEVLLGGRPGFFQYWVRYLDVRTASQGYLASLPVNGSLCQNYVWLAPQPALERRSMVFFPTTPSNRTFMQLGALYEYHFVDEDTGACNAPGVWTIGLTGPGIPFRPVVAGQEKGAPTRRSLFALTSTGENGKYWLMGCPCDVGCGACIEFFVNSFQVEGNRVLGVGAQTGVIVQFERIFVSTAEQ